MKTIIIGSIAAAVALAACNKRSVTPVENTTPEGQPDRQHATPTTGSETGQGSGTRSDYKPSTGPGGSEETR